MQATIQLQANVRRLFPASGRFFLLEDTGAAASVELLFRVPGLTDESFSVARRGMKLSLLAGRFEQIELLSTVNAAVQVIVSENQIDVDFTEGTNVNATLTNLPIPVSNDRGTPANLLYVSGVTVADAPAVAASSNAAVACGPAAAVIAAADATRRAVRFANLGPDPVSIGPAGLTWAQRVIVLNAGDVWVEERAANLAWSGITDAAKAASVTWQGITA